MRSKIGTHAHKTVSRAIRPKALLDLALLLAVVLVAASCHSCAAEEAIKTNGRRISDCRFARPVFWFERLQNPDGSWPGGIEPQSQVVCTGLVLLTLSGAGESEESGPHKKQIAAAHDYLLWAQDEAGLISSPRSSAALYEHAIATLALAEAFRLNPRNDSLREAAQRALAYSGSRQLSGGLWPASPGGTAASLYTSACLLMASWSASRAGIVVEGIDLDRARAALMAADPAGKTSPEEPRLCSIEAVHAAVALTRRLLDDEEAPTRTEMPDSDQALAEFLSGAEVKSPWADPAFWYLECALRKLSGDESGYRAFTDSLASIVVPSSKDTEDLHGGWPAVGTWGEMGGPAYTSAFYTLALEVYYRYGVFPF